MDTWHAKSAAYMKREAMEIADKPEAEQVAALKKMLWERTEARKAVTSSPSWKNYCELSKTSPFVKMTSYNPSVIRGTPMLAAMRTGAMWTAEKAAYAKLIDRRWKKRCPCCNKKVPETMAHMLLKCAKWRKERKKMTNKINDALKKSDTKIEWLKKDLHARMTLLLGGAAAGCDFLSFWMDGFSNKAARSTSQGTKLHGGELALHCVAEYLASIQERLDASKSCREPSFKRDGNPAY